MRTSPLKFISKDNISKTILKFYNSSPMSFKNKYREVKGAHNLGDYLAVKRRKFPLTVMVVGNIKILSGYS